MMKFFKRFLSDKSGQTMAEYALILAVIAVAVIATVTLLGDEIKNTFNDIINAF